MDQSKASEEDELLPEFDAFEPAATGDRGFAGPAWAGQAGLPSFALQAMLTADPATPIAAAESTTTAMVPHSQGALLHHPRTSARSRASP